MEENQAPSPLHTHYSYLDGERQSRQYWQQEYRTVHIHGRVPKRSTSRWINVLSCSGFFCRDFQLRVPLSSMLGCALWECATAHSCSSESQLTTRLERGECGREEERLKVLVSEETAGFDRYIKTQGWLNCKADAIAMFESWISTIASFWCNVPV